MVLLAGQSSASLTSSASETVLSRRARPRRDPAARWVNPVISPLAGPGLPQSDASFARFVSEALLCDPAEALELAVRAAPTLVTGVQWAHFLVLTESMGEGLPQSLNLACSSGGPHEPGSITVPVNDGITGWVARSGVAAVEGDASLHTAYSHEYEAQLFGRSPILCLPVSRAPLHENLLPAAAAGRPTSREPTGSAAAPATPALSDASGAAGDSLPYAGIGGEMMADTGGGAPFAPPNSRLPSRQVRTATPSEVRTLERLGDAPAPNLAGVLVLSGRFGTPAF